MSPFKALCFGIQLCSAAALVTNASATTTYSEAYSAVAGYPIDFHSETSGVDGTSASAGHALDGASVSSSSTSSPGVLHVQSSSRVSAPTTANGSARADWSGSFFFSSPGYSSSSTGTFTGSVAIGGGLQAEYVGQGVAQSAVVANVSIGPNTGYNGGGVSLQGGGRRTAGASYGNVLEGLESFTLNFTDVPFTFGRPIDVYLRIEVTSMATTGIGTAISSSNYGNSMTWQGITAVHDQSGLALTNFSAIDPESGFNFASPVPEPETGILMCIGIAAIFVARRRQAAAATRALG